MVLENITTSFINSISDFSLAKAWYLLQPLILFLIGMTIYSIFVFKFYKFMSRKEIFRLTEGGGSSAMHKIAYVMEYIFLFPVIAFFWFFVISSLLMMLSQIIKVTNIFIASMATLATIRVTANYNEELSTEIAKIIPFVLLASLIFEITSISIDAPLKVLYQLPSVIDTLVYYFIFIVLLEIILKVVFHRKR